MFIGEIYNTFLLFEAKGNNPIWPAWATAFNYGSVVTRSLGWAGFFRSLITQGNISLTRHEKNNTTKISAHFTSGLTQHTSIEKKY